MQLYLLCGSQCVCMHSLAGDGYGHGNTGLEEEKTRLTVKFSELFSHGEPWASV